MEKLYFSLYSYIHNYCIEALLIAKSPVFPSDKNHCVSWVYKVNNMFLLEKKFGFSTSEVGYSKSRKTFSRCYVCFEQRTGRKWALTSEGATSTAEPQFSFSHLRWPLLLPCWKQLLTVETLTALWMVQEINAKPSTKQKHIFIHQPSLTEVILMHTSGKEQTH